MLSADGSFPLMWLGTNGQPLDCEDKIRALNETLEEVIQHVREALEDAALVGCDEKIMRENLRAAIAHLPAPFAKAS